MRWASIGIALLLAGCGVSEPDLTELDRMQLAWAARAPQAYHFTFGRICFCLPVHPDDPRGGPITVVVRNEVVIRAFYAASGLELDATELARTPSITGFFRIAQDAVARKAHIVRPTLDEREGFIRSLYIDYIEFAADDEVEYVVGGFAVDS